MQVFRDNIAAGHVITSGDEYPMFGAADYLPTIGPPSTKRRRRHQEILTVGSIGRQVWLR